MFDLFLVAFLIWCFSGFMMAIMFTELSCDFDKSNIQQKIFCVLSFGPLIWIGALMALTALYFSKVYICVFNWLGKYDKKD